MDVSDRHETDVFSIRSASPDDYEAVRELWSQSGLPFRPGIRDSKEGFRRQIEQFEGLYLVATDGDRIVGAILGSHDVRKGWINRLAVSPPYRRRGIAEALVRVCEAAIRALGIEIVATLVEEPNDASCKFFEKVGYHADVPVRYYRKLSHPGA